MRRLQLVEITAALWLAIPLAGVRGAESEFRGDPQLLESSGQDADYNIVHYFDRRARQETERLRKRGDPAQFSKEADEHRRFLRATY